MSVTDLNEGLYEKLISVDLFMYTIWPKVYIHLTIAPTLYGQKYEDTPLNYCDQVFPVNGTGNATEYKDML